MTHVLASYLLFEDDSLGVQKLHQGTLEECQKTAELIDAVMYNGGKKVKESGVRWMPLATWEEFVAGCQEEQYVAADQCAGDNYGQLLSRRDL